MNRISAIVVLTFVTCSTAMAWDQDPVQQYIQRSETITLQAGDAQNSNTAAQVIDPWPRNVGNRQIPGNGDRMSGAIERYRDVSKLPTVPKPMAPIFDVQTGASGGSGATGSR